MVTLHAMEDQLTEMDRSHTLMVRSVLPLTSLFPSKCKHRTSPECPARVITDQGEFVFTFQTLIVLSCDPLTILLPSNCTQLMWRGRREKGSEHPDGQRW